jgi:acyl-coenzyme A synthetase/AMP-(fatty) acid ligase
MFLILEDKHLSYEKLIIQINNGSVDNFFSSFVADLVSNNNIDLLNYKLNNQKSTVIDKNDLKNKILNSKSKIILKTSGTTGEPKIKEHKVSFLLERTKKFNYSSCWLFTYNKFHMGGIQVLLQVLVNFDTIIDAHNKSRDYITNCIHTHSVSNISATPTFYRLLMPYENKFHSVKRITIGGERVDRETLQLIKNNFPNSKINNIYATTETGAILFSKTDQFKLNDRILIKNGVLFVKVSDSSLHDTGDLVEMIDDETFIFCGRNKNIINVGGRNVNPIQIEDIIKKHSCVKDVVVYGRENKLLGNVLTCDIVLISEVTKKEIRQFLKQNIEEMYMMPRIINFKESLKISDTNKVLR